jgi:hypothetical protein
VITPELTKVIRNAMDVTSTNLQVALPGCVQSVDPLTGCVDIELQLKNPLPSNENDGTYVNETYPVLMSVPVSQLRAGDFFVSLPITAGVKGVVVFCDLSIGDWLTLGKLTSAGDIRRHKLSGGVFYPGLYPFTEPLTLVLPANQMALGKDNGTQLRANGTTIDITTAGASAATDFVAMSAKVDLLWTTLWTVFNSWIVTPQDGGAALKTAFLAAFPPPGPTSTKSSNLKAD